MLGRGVQGEKTEKRKRDEEFWRRQGTYTITFEQYVQVLAGFAIFVFHERALVNGVVPVRFRAVAAVKTFLS